MLLHQAVQRRLRQAALVVNRCAIRRLLGLPADGLHGKRSIDNVFRWRG